MTPIHYAEFTQIAFQKVVVPTTFLISLTSPNMFTSIVYQSVHRGQIKPKKNNFGMVEVFIKSHGVSEWWFDIRRANLGTNQPHCSRVSSNFESC